MLETLKHSGKLIGQEIGKAWESLSDGWRELLNRSSDSLTHFIRGKDEKQPVSNTQATFPRWGLLACEVEEMEKEIVVRVELPGMQKEDCRIAVEGNTLYLSGEKRYTSEIADSTFHRMERAYGAFQRAIPLPRSVDIDNAKASYNNGVLIVSLPKENAGASRTIPVL